MSLSAVATLVAPPLQSLDHGTMELPLLLRTPRADICSTELKLRPIVQISNLSKPLQFINATKNPEVERKSDKNRRVVRSNAIKHAVQRRKQTAIIGQKSIENPRITEPQPDPSPKENSVRNASHNNAGATKAHSHEQCLQPLKNLRPRCLWPMGTVGAGTNSSELNLVASHFHKIKLHYSIFSHLLDDPDSNTDLSSVVLQTPVIFHATLYVATMQHHSCIKTLDGNIRSPLIHEAFVLRHVRNAISEAAPPPEEIIFATALLGISQLIFERNGSGAAHLKGVAQMVRLRGGIQCMTMPVLFNLLEWLVGMHTLNIASDVEYGRALPPPFDIRPQLPCHSLDESLRPSEELSFMFLARRRVLYKEIARNMQMLGPAVRNANANDCKAQAQAAMVALNNWRPVDSGVVAHEHVPQLDETTRLAGLLYYHLVYNGAMATVCVTIKVLQLQSGLSELRNEQHVFGMLYHGCSNRVSLILWHLYCGGVFATDDVRAWYTSKIKTISGGTGKDWNRTKNILKKFLWDDAACEEPMKQLWHESLSKGEDDMEGPLVALV